MKYTLSAHARKRMQERSIPLRLVESALQSPDKVSYDRNRRLLVKKLYLKRDQERLLLIAGEFETGELRIITVIDTSKVKKYL